MYWSLTLVFCVVDGTIALAALRYMTIMTRWDQRFFKIKPVAEEFEEGVTTLRFSGFLYKVILHFKQELWIDNSANRSMWQESKRPKSPKRLSLPQLGHANNRWSSSPFARCLDFFRWATTKTNASNTRISHADSEAYPARWFLRCRSRKRRCGRAAEGCTPRRLR